jgi:hypothetical protein
LIHTPVKYWPLKEKILSIQATKFYIRERNHTEIRRRWNDIFKVLKERRLKHGFHILLR